MSTWRNTLWTLLFVAGFLVNLRFDTGQVISQGELWEIRAAFLLRPWKSPNAPAGNGRFMFAPKPRPYPVSSRAPVPGYQGDWCVLKTNTESSW